MAKANLNYAQLADGSAAPDWMLKDIQGVKHQLYSYLSKDKAVVLSFMNTWNNTAWTYHSSGALKNFYQNNGLSSANYRAMVFLIESDAATNVPCIYGSTKACVGGTQGDWVVGTNYPIIDNATLKAGYQVSSFPYQYLVCPNKNIYTIGLLSASDLEVAAQLKCGWATAPLTNSISLVRDNDCYGAKDGLISLNTGGGIPPYSYKWSNGETQSLLTNLAAGTYRCTITDAQGKTLETPTIAVSENPKIVIEDEVKPYQSCGSLGEIKLKTSGGVPNYTFLWNTGGGFSNLKNLTSGGVFSVTVTDIKGCKASKSITVDAFTNMPFLAGDTIKTLTCGQTSVALEPTISPVNGNYTYKWTNQKNEMLGNTTKLLDVSQTGVYQFLIQDKLSLCSATKKFTVSQDMAVPMVDFGVVADFHCNNNNVVLNPSVSGGTSFLYRWELDSMGVKKNLGTATSIVATMAGTYFLTVTNSESGCVKIDKRTITAWANPKVFVSADDGIKCYGDKTASALAIGNEGKKPYTYIWSSGVFVGDMCSGLGAGSVSVTLIDANGCKAVAIDSVQEPSKLVLALSATKLSCYGDKTASLTANVLGGTAPYSYQWSNGKVTTQNVLTGLGSGQIGLTALDANNCSIIGKDTIFEPSALGLSYKLVQPKTNVSNDGSIDMTYWGGTPLYRFLWTKNGVKFSENEDLTGLGEGIYQVTMTDANGCEKNLAQAIVLKGTTIGLEDVFSDGTIEVFPNPVKDVLQVSLNFLNEKAVSLQLFDHQGRLLSQKKDILRKSIVESFDMVHFSEGFYVLLIRVDGKIWLQKIIRN